MINEKNEVIETIETSELSSQLSLSAGDYKVRLTTLVRGLASEEASEISVKVLGAKMPQVALMGVIPTETGFELKWGENIQGALYTGQIERQDVAADNKEDWQSVYSFEKTPQEELKVPVNLKPGFYRISIAAAADGWRSSEKVIKKFLIKPKIRDLSSIDSEIESRYDFSQISK